MTTLDEKRKWPSGTRVIYKGPVGLLTELKTDGGDDEYIFFNGVAYQHCRDALTGEIAAWLPVEHLELASDWEECVRWEVRGEDGETLWSSDPDESNEYFKLFLKHSRKNHPDRRFRGVRITTRRRKR